MARLKPEILVCSNWHLPSASHLLIEDYLIPLTLLRSHCIGFLKVVATDGHKLGGLKQYTFIRHSSGAQECKSVSLG